MTESLDLRRVKTTGDSPASVRAPEPVLFQPSRRSESAAQTLDPILPIHGASAPLTPTAVIAPPAMPRGPYSAGLAIEHPRPATPIAEDAPTALSAGDTAALAPEDAEDASTALRAPLPLPLPPPPPPPAPLVTHNVSTYTQIMSFLGYGRGASRERKLLLSMLYNLGWGTAQVVLIITMLAIGAHTESKTMPGLNEWEACDRPLGAWACIYVFRVVFSSSLTYWGWLRDRKIHANAEDAENATGSSTRPTAATANSSRRHSSSVPSPPSRSSTLVNSEAPEAPPLPYTVLYSRLSILSSLITLSWFLTAHILEYTSMHSCRFSSPHVWWLIFGILCIMYLVVLEVIILGFVVFVVAPIIFLFWNIFLMCLGRHPMQNPGMIRPDVGKLSPSIVDRIPLVMYIPPPPDALPGSIPIPQAVYSSNAYPPKAGLSSAKPKRRFKFLHRRKGNKDGSNSPAGDVPVRTHQQAGEPQTWQDHWEHTGYPFVVLEGNRAACAVCLMDFEEPKRIAGFEPTPTAAPPAEEPAPSTPAIEEVAVETNDTAATTENQLKLEDAGEGAVPLRLLACGHVFHKTCLDPWLTDVSGRCPVCQRAVELPAKHNKRKRRS
ncbi:hypothetical protein MSAN_00030400 [Mycena sanguinolenta]|uniref:RING-type domain-containing protein n=1 Tax=Mycena sanguinolenta TaxID=230812 RepID=A0A8H6ZBS7_9AGAR|nr:hypothetical protein MSAN_00030400 [Mycena sanguinolenta]